MTSNTEAAKVSFIKKKSLKVLKRQITNLGKILQTWRMNLKVIYQKERRRKRTRRKRRRGKGRRDDPRI